jgi:hypothetical protein
LFAAANETTALVVSERSSATGEFGVPEIIWSKPAAEGALGSPAISEDCRSLYYVDATFSGGTYEFKAMMVTR